ncbi:MAG TPA: CHASE4 domain-containing protein [Caulobacterales bacterium]|nr:CHASE4 domain-containing protein [Caulobacterales bacterium]
MSITTKTAVALFSIFATLLAGAWFVLDHAVRPGFVRLESEAHARDVARVEANLGAMRQDIESRTLDYAQWDDTYAFIASHRRAFITANFPNSWFTTYGVDLLAFVDNSGRLVWSGETDRNGRLEADHFDAGQVAAHLRLLPRSADPKSGVIWTAEGPLLYVAARATRNNGVGAPRGLLIMGRRIKQDALREQMQLDVSLINAASPAPDLAARMRGLGNGAQTWVSADASRTLIGLFDGEGVLTGAVLASSPRTVTALGARSLNIALLLFAAVLTLAAVSLWVLLRRLVIARITRLQRHFDAQSSTLALLPQADPSASDEVERLTAAYNALVLRLRAATERERQAIRESESAAAANRMKSDFLANISHEFRTPLNAVIGYAELVEEDLAEAGMATAAGDLHRIRSAARHLLSLINEILDLSKIEAGRLEITPASFAVGEMLDSVVDTVAPLLRQNGNRLAVDAGSDLGNAYSDELRLRQCLINLLSNAAKFTQQGEITLTARRLKTIGGDMLRFEVSDTGIGMTEAQLARVFEPFVQADADIARRFGGTGLGLAITRKLMALLGGSIDAKSAQGVGSTFVLTVPAVADMEQSGRGSAPARAHAA